MTTNSVTQVHRRHFMLDAAMVLNDPQIAALDDCAFRGLMKLWSHCCLFGSIPSNERQQAAIVGVRVDHWRPRWKLVAPFFKVQDEANPGLLVSPMLQADAEQYAAKCLRLQENARKGGAATKRKRESQKTSQMALPEERQLAGQTSAHALHSTSLHSTSQEKSAPVQNGGALFSISAKSASPASPAALPRNGGRRSAPTPIPDGEASEAVKAAALRKQQEWSQERWKWWDEYPEYRITGHMVNGVLCKGDEDLLKACSDLLPREECGAPSEARDVRKPPQGF